MQFTLNITHFIQLYHHCTNLNITNNLCIFINFCTQLLSHSAVILALSSN
uniref:Uncharacterized protein n=1 Tax=Cyriopagopus schmidti TaxID=29017 RepID=B5M6G2_CYRSC|nr:unknown [Cyriopagopus schmidti]